MIYSLVWRIGLMGHSCRRNNVLLFPAALETVLKTQGYPPNPVALDAATEVYDKAC